MRGTKISIEGGIEGGGGEGGGWRQKARAKQEKSECEKKGRGFPRVTVSRSHRPSRAPTTPHLLTPYSVPLGLFDNHAQFHFCFILMVRINLEYECFS